jgi:Fe-S-cluster-containing hydrogenase component 2
MPSVDYITQPKYNLGIESEVGAKSIAVKCDLCVGREDGPACVEVCPTEALSFENNNNAIDDTAKRSLEVYIKERAKFL